MPLGARLVIAAAMAVLGAAGVQAGQSAGSWTDPPARTPSVQPEAEPAKEAPKAAAPAPAAQQAAPPVARAEAPRKPARAARRETRRTTARPRVAARAVPRVQEERRAVYAARPAPRRLRYAEPMPVGIAPLPGETMADPRMERLSSAEAAGYLVVRRRTVVYPDGRAIRIYRPLEAGDEFD
jgi:hypothetical protein